MTITEVTIEKVDCIFLIDLFFQNVLKENN